VFMVIILVESVILDHGVITPSRVPDRSREKPFLRGGPCRDRLRTPCQVAAGMNGDDQPIGQRGGEGGLRWRRSGRRRGLNVDEGGWLRRCRRGLIQAAQPTLPEVDPIEGDALGPAEGPRLQATGLPGGKEGTALRNRAAS